MSSEGKALTFIHSMQRILHNKRKNSENNKIHKMRSLEFEKNKNNFYFNPYELTQKLDIDFDVL